jgi:long-chain fatty acid transport protein
MNQLFKTSLLAASVSVATLSAGQVFAAGFQLSEHSVSALGRANAGAASHADNAAILARNPAASTQFDSVELSVAVHMVNPDVDVKGENTISEKLLDGVYAQTLAGALSAQAPQAAAEAAASQARAGFEMGYNQYLQGINGSENASGSDVAPNALIPGFYVAIPFSEKLAFGVSANSYFGLSSDFGNQYNASEEAGETSIETFYLTPSIAYKISDSISIGLGLQYVYGEGKLNNYASSSLEAVTAVSVLANPLCQPDPTPCQSQIVKQGTTLLDLEGDGDGFGFQLGLMWDINEKSSIGFRYQSEVELEFDGDISYLPLAAVNTGNTKGKGSLSVDLPEMIEIGYSNQIHDQWTIHGTILYTGWSSFEELTADIDETNAVLSRKVGEVQLKEEMWDDAFSVSLGADYSINEITTFRAGIAYDESPVSDEFRTLTIPDSDRLWYSVGATVKVGDGGSIDAAVLYIDGKSANVNETFNSTDLTQEGNPTTPLTEFNGELGKVSATIFSLGYNHKF